MMLHETINAWQATQYHMVRLSGDPRVLCTASKFGGRFCALLVFLATMLWQLHPRLALALPNDLITVRMVYIIVLVM